MNFFFFQAEDGIRDGRVTGVQTCALPISVPFWVRLSQELGDERRERIRAAERTEIAAHLHDSVLQTLALIQRQAEQPREVRRLARSQERDLRTWLYGPTG